MKTPGFSNRILLMMYDWGGHVLSLRIKKKSYLRWFEKVAQVRRNQVKF